MERDEILKVYDAGPEAVVQLVTELIQGFTRIVEKQSEEIAQLKGRVITLEQQLNKNSHNSSKPPSSDGFNKPNPKSLRDKGQRPPGGQKGHPGHTLKFTCEPDHVKLHRLTSCACGYCLEDQPPVRHEKRQVWDIPPMRVEVTEHQAEVKRCPRCGEVTKAAFPTEVSAPLQYGTRMKSLWVYLNQYQLLPYERICELFQDWFAHVPSQGTLVNSNHDLYNRLEPITQHIAETIRQCAVVHFDETSLQVEGKKQWLHSASTSTHTHYNVHPRRGNEGMDSAGILPTFQGIAVHDAWKSYFFYGCRHVLCNAHHLRDLTFVLEQEKQLWAGDMIEFLMQTKTIADSQTILSFPEIKALHIRYDQILLQGMWETYPRGTSLPPRNKGHVKLNKGQNLLERFARHREGILAFVQDHQIPFDNNLAERDIRMMKVQQKISGTFRSEQGAQVFCRIRGFLSTMRKQSRSILEGIQAVLKGSAVLPIETNG